MLRCRAGAQEYRACVGPGSAEQRTGRRFASPGGRCTASGTRASAEPLALIRMSNSHFTVATASAGTTMPRFTSPRLRGEVGAQRRVRGTFRRPCSWKIPLTPALSPQAGRGSSRLSCQTSTSAHTRLLIPRRVAPELSIYPSPYGGRGECRMHKRTRSLAWENKNHTSSLRA
jgi:hypothetical protein